MGPICADVSMNSQWNEPVPCFMERMDLWPAFQAVESRNGSPGGVKRSSDPVGMALYV